MRIIAGIPIGLTASIPLILSSRKVSYADQAVFSFAWWSFSMKLLWAPIVDAYYIKRIGRRKTWLVPVELLIGILMLALADYVNKLLDEKRMRETKGERNES
jgi:MFS transporter, PAT family, solute carrier family 33 (acetyl-CoA transportor), member 1